MASGTLLHKPHLPWCNLVVLWFLSNLDSHRGWSMVWMYDIPVYWLCPRLVRPCWCIHKKCGMGGNISMASSSLSINPHTTLGMAEQSAVPDKTLGPHIAWSMTWMDVHPVWSVVWMCDIPVFWWQPRLFGPCPCIHRNGGGKAYMTFSPWSPPWGWVDDFAVSTKSWSTSWFICNSHGYYPCVLVVSQICQTFPIHQQDMW